MGVKDYWVIISPSTQLMKRGEITHNENLVVTLMLNGLCKGINNSIDMNG